MSFLSRPPGVLLLPFQKDPAILKSTAKVLYPQNPMLRSITPSAAKTHSQFTLFTSSHFLVCLPSSHPPLSTNQLQCIILSFPFFLEPQSIALIRCGLCSVLGDFVFFIFPSFITHISTSLFLYLAFSGNRLCVSKVGGLSILQKFPSVEYKFNINHY